MMKYLCKVTELTYTFCSVFAKQVRILFFFGATNINIGVSCNIENKKRLIFDTIAMENIHKALKQIKN